MEDLNNKSCTMSFGSSNKWTRDEDDQWGTWWIEGEVLMWIYRNLTQDIWNSGKAKGVRKFKKRITKVDDQDVEWWECFEPYWYPTTKMVKSGTAPPWEDPWKDFGK